MTLHNCIAIGYDTYVTTAGTAMIGKNITRVGFGKEAGVGEAMAFYANGAYLSSGGTWTNASDRNVKENITAVNSAEVLGKIMQLPITQWNYINEDDGVKHIGPMAQDFYAAFGLGRDERSISTIDPAGVALVAIQELNKKQQELQKTMEELQQKTTEINQLKTMLESLQSEVSALKVRMDSAGK
ncbi:MAG: hypothetical protein EP344_03015 [Bacteroidetes bacterium]|nr:MAG: hypothetical protein EP344_03015 [Bacteroidota bacterium]